MTGVNGTTTSAQFTYNGDGQKVKSVINGETTLLVGGHYEQKGSQITKYYFAGASRIAMRKYTIPQSMTVEYMLGDHLGSTSITTDNTGAIASEMRYEPWGEIRYSWTANQSTTPAYKLPVYTFTGQRSYMDDPSTSGMEGFGLMDYNARMYDPQVGRFAQADTIVPGGVQGLDRYAYVNNSPVNYTDPTGHFSPEAIKTYIQTECAGQNDPGTREYNNCVSQTLYTWQHDTDWWDMLSNAREGDILIVRSFGELQYYQFSGKGITSLNGITPYGHSVEDPTADATLSEIQSGVDADCDWCNSPKPRYGWFGFIRFDDNHMPSFWLRPGVNMTQRKGFKAWARWGIDATVAGFFFLLTDGLSKWFQGGATLLGVGLDEKVNDALDIQEGDREVCFGDGSSNYRSCMIFQPIPAGEGDSGGGYTIEH